MEIPTVNMQQQTRAATIKRIDPAGRGNLPGTFVLCFLSIMFAGIASMLMSVYLPVIVNDLLGKVTAEKINTVAAYLNSIFIFGSMFGGLTWGVICDKIGRRKAVILSTALYGLFTALTGFSSSWLLTGICRFITGFGVGGVILTTNILVAEIWPLKKKAVALGLVSSAMPVGFIIAGAMNNLLSNWHSAFLTGIVPLIVAIMAVFTLPESEGWTTDRANKKDNPITQPLFGPDVRNNLLAGSVIFGAMLIGLWAVFSWAPTWVQSIGKNDAASGDLRGLTMMVLAVSGLVGSIVSGWIVNAIGLRRTMMICFAACFILTYFVFKRSTVVSEKVFVGMGILAFFFGISQGALAFYIPAMFPSDIRASATGFCFNVGRLFTGTVVFFIGALVALLGGYGNAIFVFSFIFLIGLVSAYFSQDKKKDFVSVSTDNKIDRSL